MEQPPTETARQALQRVPMSRTVFWLASLPLSLPAWLLLAVWSNCVDVLKRLLRHSFSEQVSGSVIGVSTGAGVEAEAQTDMDMSQLEGFMRLSILNQEAVTALIDHQQQLELNRQVTGTLQSKLKFADDCAALMKQCITDLQNRNARLHQTLADVVLPVLEKVACHAETTTTPAVPDSSAVQPLPSELLMDALVYTRQVLEEAEVADIASGDSSPSQKQPSEEIDEGKKPAMLLSATANLSRAFAMEDGGAGIRKVLSFGPSTRPACVVHVLAHDV